jgi:tRNA (guanosine-2'-O-)-methyltransferase
MNHDDKKEIIQKYAQCMTASRFEKIERVSQHRTHYATVVLEDIQQPHNISAAIRSTECFGVQNVHVIEQRFKYILNQNVTKGAGDWVDIHRYKQHENNTRECFKTLKDQGYMIYGATPHTHDTRVQDLPLDKPVAIVFGTEYQGLSSYALENVDGYVKIPMYGFTESFNISVSVAICLHNITSRIYASDDIAWRMSQDEIYDLQIKWLKKSML